MLLFAPNVKGEYVNYNFQIIDLLVQSCMAGVTGTLILFTLQFCYTTIELHVGSFTCRIFNSLYMHKTGDTA